MKNNPGYANNMKNVASDDETDDVFIHMFQVAKTAEILVRHIQMNRLCAK